MDKGLAVPGYLGSPFSAMRNKHAGRLGVTRYRLASRSDEISCEVDLIQGHGPQSAAAFHTRRRML